MLWPDIWRNDWLKYRMRPSGWATQMPYGIDSPIAWACRCSSATAASASSRCLRSVISTTLIARPTASLSESLRTSALSSHVRDRSLWRVGPLTSRS